VATYLVGFLYHEPESWALYHSGIFEDFESSTGIFVDAPSKEEAISWTEKIAEALLRRANKDDSLDWKALGYKCWIEEDPSASNWSHCLSFFQSVKVGEWPNLDAMGTLAYDKWVEANGLKYS